MKSPAVSSRLGREDGLLGQMAGQPQREHDGAAHDIYEAQPRGVGPGEHPVDEDSGEDRGRKPVNRQPFAPDESTTEPRGARDEQACPEGGHPQSHRDGPVRGSSGQERPTQPTPA